MDKKRRIIEEVVFFSFMAVCCLIIFVSLGCGRKELPINNSVQTYSCKFCGNSNMACNFNCVYCGLTNESKCEVYK